MKKASSKNKNTDRGSKIQWRTLFIPRVLTDEFLGLVTDEMVSALSGIHVELVDTDAVATAWARRVTNNETGLSDGYITFNLRALRCNNTSQIYEAIKHEVRHVEQYRDPKNDYSDVGNPIISGKVITKSQRDMHRKNVITGYRRIAFYNDFDIIGISEEEAIKAEGWFDESKVGTCGELFTSDEIDEYRTATIKTFTPTGDPSPQHLQFIDFINGMEGVGCVTTTSERRKNYRDYVDVYLVACGEGGRESLDKLQLLAVYYTVPWLNTGALTITRKYSKKILPGFCKSCDYYTYMPYYEIKILTINDGGEDRRGELMKEFIEYLVKVWDNSPTIK